MNQKTNNLIDSIDNIVRKNLRKIAVFINWLSSGKITPNSITISGAIFHLIVAWLIINNQLIPAAIFLIFFGLFDTLDGELARLQKTQSSAGALLDATTDRFKEIILYSAIAYYFVHHNQAIFAVWAVIACGFSISVSYVRAKSEAVYAESGRSTSNLGKTFKNGLLRFEVRML
ncbi:MAG TPA: CDP-alcohol phosphatidyltransferase family protein, partial [Candidatus Dormibacteraeota bacterium]|nr:CDP-alcohol phosphatidyltransferase family protein [Candidatus Dormibacteraeota bacterium]